MTLSRADSRLIESSRIAIDEQPDPDWPEALPWLSFCERESCAKVDTMEKSGTVKLVFLSSVYEGLESYRDATYKAIEGLTGYHCERMEGFGARVPTTLEFCIESVRSCDVFVGIVGQRYGSSPLGSDLSYTEIEYNTALEAGIPTLMFMAPDEFPVPADLIEPPEVRERLRAFRNRVQGRNPGRSFLLRVI